MILAPLGSSFPGMRSARKKVFTWGASRKKSAIAVIDANAVSSSSYS